MQLVRVLVLVCCCLLTFGSYFNYDMPGALADDFRETLAKNETSNVGLFYSFYSLPNTALPFFGGIVIDQILGLRKGAFICSSMIALGCTVVALAGSNPNWEGTSSAFLITLVGRFLFGLGGETLGVCQNAFCAKWFRGADLATAFAIVLSFARVGSAINFATMPAVSSKLGFPFALWLSASLCYVSVAACVALAFLDIKYESMTQETTDSTNEEEEEENEEESAREFAHAQAERAEIQRRADAYERVLDGAEADDGAYANMRREELRIQRNARRQAGRSTSLQQDDSDIRRMRVREASEALDLAVPLLPPSEEQVSKNRNPSPLEAFKAVIGAREVLIYLICVLFYIAVFIFIGPVASKFLVATYPEVDKIKAGLLVSIPYTVSAIVSPILGLTMDKVGRGGFFVMMACFSLCLIHACFAVIPHSLDPMAMMVWLGLTYSCCAASLWPMIALVVESRFISTAYGLMMSIQNMGLAAAPMFITHLIPESSQDLSGYKTIESIFSVLAFSASLCVVLLYFIDTRMGGVLFLGPTEAKLLATPGSGGSPRINPLNPRVTPFMEARRRYLAQRQAEGLTSSPLAPKTPNAIRAQYFRKLRIQSRA